MVQNYTLPLKGCQQTVLDVPEPKRRTQKDIGVQNLHNQINKLRLENQMLKNNQKQMVQDFLNMEIQRGILKEDAKLLYLKKQHVTSLICILEVLMKSIDTHCSKLSQKRIKTTLQEECPEIALDTLHTLILSPQHDSVMPANTP